MFEHIYGILGALFLCTSVIFALAVTIAMIEPPKDDKSGKFSAIALWAIIPSTALAILFISLSIHFET
ncbi:MAG: hypothetical protein ABIR91_01040 [Candidatus Saccharimonadales bacterium]